MPRVMQGGVCSQAALPESNFVSQENQRLRLPALPPRMGQRSCHDCTSRPQPIAATAPSPRRARLLCRLRSRARITLIFSPTVGPVCGRAVLRRPSGGERCANRPSRDWSMSNKMLVDATHPEETRVVVLRGNRVEEFDFESASRKQLRGNIYLAKVTRVEPSLQAAFIDYGGNRHGFLAFSEIHPDYYQIPVADRQALIDEEERAHRDAEAEADRRASIRRQPSQRQAAERRSETEVSEPIGEDPAETDTEATASAIAEAPSDIEAEVEHGKEPQTGARRRPGGARADATAGGDRAGPQSDADPQSDGDPRDEQNLPEVEAIELSGHAVVSEHDESQLDKSSRHAVDTGAHPRHDEAGEAVGADLE